jgi:lipopolysaccharide transport system permease protein
VSREATRGGVASPVVIDASWRSRLSVREAWHFREVFLRLAGRDITVRYRQTVLGVAWVILQPLLSAAIFAVLFGAIGRFPSGGKPYFLVALAGMVGWIFFSTLVARGSIAIADQVEMVTKVFFPRILLPLSVAGAAAMDLAVGVATVLVAAIVFRSLPDFGVVLLPVWVAILLLGGSGTGLIAASLMVKFRDVRLIVPVLLQLLLFSSPVAYSMSAVSGRYQVLLMVNPLSGAIEGFKWSLTGSTPPSMGSIVYSMAASIVVWLIGLAVFVRREREFADVI